MLCAWEFARQGHAGSLIFCALRTSPLVLTVSVMTAQQPPCLPSAPRPALQAADFQRAMGTRPVARSPHFSVHFLPPVDKLSTTPVVAGVNTGSHGRLGLVLPKRMARRAVTRNLIKHQARALWCEHVRLHGSQPDHVPSQVPGALQGDWVLRLKAPWPVAEFPSAKSQPLKQAVRAELMALLASLVRKKVP